MRKYCFMILILFTSALLLSCKQKAPAEKPESIQLIKAFTIQADDQYSTRNYPAKVDADKKVNLSFLVSGRIIDLPIEEGQQIKKGQLIAKLDAKEYEIRVAQKKAEYDFAKVTFDRYAKLLPTEAISKAQYDEKKSLYDLAKANLDEAKKDLSDTQIFAPFTGLIGKRFVENYQYVLPRQEIASLQDIDDIELKVFIPEQDISNAEEIKKLNDSDTEDNVGLAEFSSLPGEVFPLKVKSATTQADPKTQNYEIKFIMKRPKDKLILPGMTANVKIKFSDRNTNIQIPFSAVMVSNQGKHFVWKVNLQTMTVSKKPVQLGKVNDDKVDIIKGLSAGDTIVAAGAAYVTSGMKVKIQTQRIGH